LKSIPIEPCWKISYTISSESELPEPLLHSRDGFTIVAGHVSPQTVSHLLAYNARCYAWARSKYFSWPPGKWMWKIDTRVFSKHQVPPLGRSINYDLAKNQAIDLRLLFKSRY